MTARVRAKTEIRGLYTRIRFAYTVLIREIVRNSIWLATTTLLCENGDGARPTLYVILFENEYYPKNRETRKTRKKIKIKTNTYSHDSWYFGHIIFNFRQYGTKKNNNNG